MLMFTSVAVEGMRFRAKNIPRKQLVLIWKTLTNEPFPRVKAFLLRDYDFDDVVRSTRCKEDALREMVEWGKVLSASGTDACVFNSEDSADGDYIILIRSNPYHALREVLEHELSHIARGDL
jgi:hypothetical protein